MMVINYKINYNLNSYNKINCHIHVKSDQVKMMMILFCNLKFVVPIS